MRAQIKLIALVLVAALVQCGLMDWRPLRAAWFDARAWYYQSRGDLASIDRMAAEGTDDIVLQLRAARMLPPDDCMVEHVCYPDPEVAGEVDGDGADRHQPAPTQPLPQVAPETDDSSDL